MNMGASGVAPSFAAPYGAKMIRRMPAILLFAVIVVIGAVLLGKNVSITLGKSLLPKEFMHFDVALIILAAASLSLFAANILKIPQSTSQVTITAVVGAGLYFGHLSWRTLLLKIIPMWIVLPLLSYLLTLALYRIIYPPREGNLRLYEKIFLHENKLRIVSLALSCYVAFAIGSNNVANAVGPLSGAGIIGVMTGLLLISPLFGAGAFVMGKGNLETAGKEIVPLGTFSASLVSFVTGSLLIVASVLGVPQSLVQLNIFSILAVSSLKKGAQSTIDHHVTQKTFIIWAVTPLLSAAIAYGLLALFVKR